MAERIGEQDKTKCSEKILEGPGANGEASQSEARWPLATRAPSTASDETKPEVEGDAGTSGRIDGKNKVRSSALREQNSRAQKRYRERQTLQKATMESELQKLHEDAEACLFVENRSKDLKVQLVTLEQLVASHDHTLSGFQSQSFGGGGSISAAELNDMKAGKEVRVPQTGEASKKSEELDALQKSWLLQLNQLMSLVMGPELEHTVKAQIIADGQAVCLQMDQVKDIGPTWMNSLLIADLEIPQCFNVQGDVVYWKKVASTLSLQDNQVEQLRAMRSESMFRLDSLYVVRGMLNQQMQTLCMGWKQIIEDCSKILSEDKLIFVQRLGRIGQEGICIMDALKDNLISEQQALGAFNTEFIQTVLMPQQAMRFLVEINLQHAQQVQLAQICHGVPGMPPVSLLPSDAPPTSLSAHPPHGPYGPQGGGGSSIAQLAANVWLGANSFRPKS